MATDVLRTNILFTPAPLAGTGVLLLLLLITSNADTCVYYCPTSTHSVDLIVSIFVDNDIVCTSKEHDLDDVIQHLANMFKVTHRPMAYYVGF